MDSPSAISSDLQGKTAGLGLSARIAAPAATVRTNEAGTVALESAEAVEDGSSPRLVIRGENHSKEPNPAAAFIDWLNFTFYFRLTGNESLMEFDRTLRQSFGFGIGINRKKKHLNYDESWELGDNYGIFATGGDTVAGTSLISLSGEGCSVIKDWLSFGCITATANIRIHQRGFVTPVNLAAFGLGTLLDGRILLIDPLLDGLWPLFVGALDRLLRRESPALEVVTDRSYRQFDAVLLLDELHDSTPCPERKFHLQLLRTLVADRAPDRFFLIRIQTPSISWNTTTRARLQGRSASFIIEINGQSNRRITQPRQLHNGHDSVSLPMQPYDLLSPLVQLLQFLVSSVFFFHDNSIPENTISSAFMLPSQ